MTQDNSYFHADRNDLLQFLQTSKQFKNGLDIGCAAGVLGTQMMRASVVNNVDGVEINPEIAKQAAITLRKVWQGSIEAVLPDIPLENYDLITMADSLEHLTDPWKVLTDLYQNSAMGTKLLISVPNIREKNVLLPLLLQGRFDYQNSGVMDRTHLHFFTRSSLINILRETGWTVEKTQPNIKRKYLKWWYPYHLLEEFIAVQYFALASK
ncbi:MAG: class I SAM-dependent methyltransferase [Sulfuriferula sp.]